jgi:hypothetical protein
MAVEGSKPLSGLPHTGWDDKLGGAQGRGRAATNDAVETSVGKICMEVMCVAEDGNGGASWRWRCASLLAVKICGGGGGVNILDGCPSLVGRKGSVRQYGQKLCRLQSVLATMMPVGIILLLGGIVQVC